MSAVDGPRHACTLCGGSCQGVFVSLLPEEVEKVEAQAKVLGIDAPVVDGKLRRFEGGCVFLGPQQRCRIHEAFGGPEKPSVCQQYPVVAVRTRQGLRVGIDPGCYTHVRTRHTGERVAPSGLIENEVPMDAQDEAFEAALVRALGGGRLAPVLDMLAGRRPDPTSPPRESFQRHLATVLCSAGLEELTTHPDFAPSIRERIQPLLEAAHRAQQEVPPWGLDPEQEAFAADAVARLLHLRVAATAIPVIPAVAVLGISGAVAAAWSTSDTDELGARLAAWVRAVRIPVFWRRIVPDTQALMTLARS
jgi:Fe-S-cluster containining protein